jgi:hypothetical protein
MAATFGSAVRIGAPVCRFTGIALEPGLGIAGKTWRRRPELQRNRYRLIEKDFWVTRIIPYPQSYPSVTTVPVPISCAREKPR